NVKDENSNIVISRINPILKDFAFKSGGKYYELDSSTKSIVSNIIADLESDTKKAEPTSIEVLSFTELFWIPLLIAILLFFAAVTKIHQLYLVLLPLAVLPDTSHAYLLDFYHLDRADSFYHKKEYLDSSKELEKVTPGVESFYNIGVAYYKDRQYKKAIQTFSKIKSTDRAVKQKLFYNMGNCAVALKKYERAKTYYRQALALGYDEDSLYNLSLLYRLKLEQKKDVSKMLPKKSSEQSTKAANKDKDKDKSKSGSSKSEQNAGESSSGSAADSKKSSEEKVQKSNKTEKAQYKIGYKAYELINKGYTDEKHPW
ncbi:MAG: tetratricopeptide repeat protein, partial [Thiovulaceae bacterium]|nr:tetratricopeptide repeat protein [Sulfurimonadaceae bacterium]